MIFVTLGTQDKSFKRLLKAVEKEKLNGNIKEKVVVQAGYTKYKSDVMEIFDTISKDEFEEYMDIINTLSYREMLYLTFMWEYAVSHQKRIVHNHWHDFSKKFNLKFPNSNVCMVYKRLTRTAFISEVIETANVEGETLSLDVEFIGYEIEPAFKRFYKVVLEKAK